jgi:heavy metal translocating P-type ATPase
VVDSAGQREACALCGLPITPPPVVDVIEGEEKHFCCQGCARVYRVAAENGMLDQVLPKPRPPRMLPKGGMLEHGKTAYFSVKGMWCAGCAAAAEQILRNELGIQDADVSFAAERGRMRYDPAKVDPAQALRRLDALGYSAQLLTDASMQEAEQKQERILIQLIVAVGFGMQVMVLYLVQLYGLYASRQFDSPDVRRLQYVVWLLATPVLFYGGNSFFRGAWRSLRARTAGMDTLVALGTLSAYLYSAYVTLRGGGEAYFDSVTMITVFIMLGRFIETLGGVQARKGVQKLLRLRPENAWRRAGDQWQQVAASTLTPGEQILVKPGERVPADAEVQEGQAAVDESLLTGESMPVNKAPGQTVYAGTVVTDNALLGRVTAVSQRSRLAQITRLVDETLATKPPVQRLADRLSAWFALGIIATAVLTAVGRVALGAPPAQALLVAVSVLVVACPCALGLATPLAVAMALGQTTRWGVLIRNPAALESAGQVQRVVLDKTGTLTLGHPAVTAVEVAAQAAISGEALLCLAAAVEQFSEHPLARAITAACSGPKPAAHDFLALPGLGASAQVSRDGERRVMVGSARFLNVDEQSELASRAGDHSQRGETVIWVGWDGSAAGLIALRDEPNPTAGEALRELNAAGVRLVMLSGDDPHTAQAIAAELDIGEYKGNCPPQEKAARIKKWQSAGEQVAMVGDGVNDAPGLAQADLSITVVGGTDVAGETSDVVLMRSDLKLIPRLIQLSRRTRRIILENLGWAFAYNLLAIPLAVGGLISPVIAAGAMATSSLLVVGNSLRLNG